MKISSTTKLAGFGAALLFSTPTTVLAQETVEATAPPRALASMQLSIKVEPAVAVPLTTWPAPSLA